MKRLTRTLLFVLVLFACTTMLYAQKAGSYSDRINNPAVKEQAQTLKNNQKPNQLKEGITANSMSLESSIREEQSLKKHNMVLVEGGTFKMGSNNGDASEKPVHNVEVRSFYICDHEVTQAEFEAVMGINPSRFKGEKLPVEMVSWDVAIEYCNKRSIQEGYEPCYSFNLGDVICNWMANGYRLPTEAEWEYAAGGGNKGFGYIYSGTNLVDTVAWYSKNSGNKTHEVKTKQPNELVLYDMSGNVSEWCWNSFEMYSEHFENNPHGPSSGSAHVIRGGSWNLSGSDCRITIRFWYDSYRTFGHLGFRVVRNAK